jgi:hypothetical protein
VIPLSSTAQRLRRAHRGRGGGEYSEDRRSMQDDQTAQDATRLLEEFSTNHLEARMVSPYGTDRPLSPYWADAEQAGLNRARRDTAIRWLIDKGMLESTEEHENSHDTGEEFHSEYGSGFRFTDAGRELLKEGRERRQA